MNTFQENRISPSVLDRLFDDSPRITQEPNTSRYQNLREAKASVARDLEAMLNTRQEALFPLPPELEASRSLICYGLPDFTALSLLNLGDQVRICQSVEQTIALFEPRLKQVQVAIEPPRDNDRALRFRIDALLQVDPVREPVVFDAMLQLGTHRYQVGQAHAG